MLEQQHDFRSQQDLYNWIKQHICEPLEYNWIQSTKMATEIAIIRTSTTLKHAHRSTGLGFTQGDLG